MNAPMLILGKNGQVGKALAAQLDRQALALERQELDLADNYFTQKLEQYWQKYPYDVIINASAYTQVDKAEGEGKAQAWRINAEAVGELAQWCARNGVKLVHFSTDYVFDGSGATPWREDDATHPLNVYGESKRAGEEAIIASAAEHLIFRTSWVYDAQGANFFTTMLRLFAEKPSLNIVADQIGAPTYSRHLTHAVLCALNRALCMPVFSSGIYHCCAGGETSWHGFAGAILALARTRFSGEDSLVLCQQLLPVPSRNYPTPALRPLNSRLDCGKVMRTFGVALPAWEAGLSECFDQYADQRLPDTRP